MICQVCNKRIKRQRKKKSPKNGGKKEDEAQQLRRYNCAFVEGNIEEMGETYKKSWKKRELI